jgi:pimeloyl-ACP methyl ester carboxylesterase
MEAVPGTARLRTGVTLPYLEQGDPAGPTLVLLHAWTESKHAFSRLMPLLPSGVHVLAIDQRGHGDADKPTTGYALADYAEDVVAFLDAIGVDAAVLLGSSSGGYVAQQVAVSHPDRVRALVLVGAPIDLRGRVPFFDEVDGLTDPISRDWARASLDWFEFAVPVPPGYLDDRVEDAVRTPAHAWKLALYGLADAEPPTLRHTITAPTLIIHGGRDALLPEDTGRRLAGAIPASRLLVYRDAAHLVLWEHPERIARDVTEFMAGLPEQESLP